MALVPTPTQTLAGLSFLAEHQDEVRQIASAVKDRFNRPKKRAKRPKRRNPGLNHIGKAASRVSESKVWTGTDEDPTSLDSRTLYSHEITDIPYGSSGNDIDTRQRHQVFLNGFNVMMSVENTSDKPVHFNVAVVMNRREPSAAPSVIDFFKGTGIDRGLNFSNTLNSNDFRSRPINPDKHVILKHKRYTLSNKEAATPVYEAGAIPSFTSIDFYMPIKRIITYNADLGNANNRIYLVYWCDEFNTGGGTLPQSNVLERSLRIHTMFKEPKIQY